MRPEINARDAFFTVGLGGVCTGVGFEFGWAWSLIVGGCVFLAVTALALQQRGN